MSDTAPSAGWLEGREHVLPVRIYYEDTDFTGVVYHANYLRYFERGRSDFLRFVGVHHAALANLRRLCDQHLPGRYRIEVIDLLENPQLAKVDQILAIPTLVRKIPEPMRRVIGDLSNAERTMIALDLQ